MTEKQQLTYLIKHYLIGFCISLPLLILLFLSSSIQPSEALMTHHPTSDLLIKAIVGALGYFCLWSIGRLPGWIYLGTAIRRLNINGLGEKALKAIGSALMGLFVLFAFISALQPNTKVTEVEGGESLPQDMEMTQAEAGLTDEQQFYKQHIKQLPGDLRAQALGMYLLNNESGNGFIQYLHLSDDLPTIASFGKKLDRLKINPEANEVFDYFKALKPQFSAQQYQAIAKSIYRDQYGAFYQAMQLPNKDVEEFGKRPLLPQILLFEVVYLLYTLESYRTDSVDQAFVKQALEGTIYRLTQTDTELDLPEGDRLFTQFHRQFYQQLLAQQDQSPTELTQTAKEWLSENGFRQINSDYFKDLVPYLLDYHGLELNF